MDPRAEPGLRTKTVSMQVARTDLRSARLVEGEVAAPAPGEALFAVERFALSGNNVTYAHLGDQLGYWDLFSREAGWGVIPVWGYLRAVDTRSPQVDLGRRAFGLCPTSTHLLMHPDRADTAGFRDASIHRSSVSGVYNAYFWAEDDSTDPATADLMMVLRPVFWLSFTLDDYLTEHHPLARHVAVTSASSKAAIGLAHLLRQRGVPTIGFTSRAHADFVHHLSVYDQVASYEELATAFKTPIGVSVLVDIAGNPALRQTILGLTGPLEALLVAGGTHWDGDPATPADSTAAGGFFFAPQRIHELTSRWGWPAVEERYTTALEHFADTATWLAITEAHGLDGALRTYRHILENNSDPAAAHLVDLTSPPVT